MFNLEKKTRGVWAVKEWQMECDCKDVAILEEISRLLNESGCDRRYITTSVSYGKLYMYTTASIDDVDLAEAVYAVFDEYLPLLEEEIEAGGVQAIDVTNVMYKINCNILKEYPGIIDKIDIE